MAVFGFSVRWRMVHPTRGRRWSTAHCGTGLLSPSAPFENVTRSGRVIAGIVPADVTEVQLTLDDAEPIRATVLDLDDLGSSAKVFVVGVPHEGVDESLLAVSAIGAQLGHFDTDEVR